jgi:hypothetical protein
MPLDGRRLLEHAVVGVQQAASVVGRLLLGGPRLTDETGPKERERIDPEKPEPAGGFIAESDMLPQLAAAATALWVERDPSSTWVLLEEQTIHSRIADLVLVRLDLNAIRARQAGDWLRPLRLNELRTLRALRPDRPTSLASIAGATRLEQDNVLRLLRRLLLDEFVSQVAPRRYQRLAPAAPLVARVVSFEAKRSDARKALGQARAHRVWANETYVGFDGHHAGRFLSVRDGFAGSGVGLIRLDPDRWKLQLRARSRRSPSRLESAIMGEQVLGRLLGAPAADRPELRLPHGHRLSSESEPVIAGPNPSWLSRLG